MNFLSMMSSREEIPSRRVARSDFVEGSLWLLGRGEAAAGERRSREARRLQVRGEGRLPGAWGRQERRQDSGSILRVVLL